MEEFSAIGSPKVTPVELPPYPFLRDHALEGEAVFPAVEALELLAQAVKDSYPATDLSVHREARFRRFIPVGSSQELRLFVETKPLENQEVQASLFSRPQGKPGIPLRSIEHVSVRFGRAESITPPPLDLLASLQGVGQSVPSERLYSDLVPFGPAYHNLSGMVFLSEEGAVGTCAALGPKTHESLLGSPYPLDAAFHLACAWSQRYANMVAFPTAIKYRCLFRLPQPGEESYCRVIPRVRDPKDLTFDLWRFGAAGEVLEAALGVKMRDVSQGRRQAVEWVRDPGNDPLAALRNHCTVLSVTELAAVAPFAWQVFTPREAARALLMGDRRKRSYLGARLALKHLARQLAGDIALWEASTIETFGKDGQRPLCSAPNWSPTGFFSAAHNDRFAVAVAAEVPVGIDVERLSDKLERVMSRFLTAGERTAIEAAGLSFRAGAARLWTAKEALAKALNLPLLTALREGVGVEIGTARSLLATPYGDVTAWHGTLDGHVLTLVLPTIGGT